MMNEGHACGPRHFSNESRTSYMQLVNHLQRKQESALLGMLPRNLNILSIVMIVENGRSFFYHSGSLTLLNKARILPPYGIRLYAKSSPRNPRRFSNQSAERTGNLSAMSALAVDYARGLCSSPTTLQPLGQSQGIPASLRWPHMRHLRKHNIDQLIGTWSGSLSRAKQRAEKACLLVPYGSRDSAKHTATTTRSAGRLSYRSGSHAEEVQELDSV